MVAPPKEGNLKRKMSKINTYKSCVMQHLKGVNCWKTWNVYRGAT